MIKTLLSIKFEFVYLITLIVSFFIGLLYYNSSSGVDFGKYIETVNFLLGDSEFVYDPQGSLYFSLIAFTLNTFIDSIGPFNINVLFNEVVQYVNLLLYLVGSIGIYKLFCLKGFPKRNVLIALIILNFLPTGFYLRLTMKPEILAFALFPWLLINLDQYFKTNHKFYLIASSICLSLITSQKASILGMVFVSLVVIYWKERKKYSKILKFLLVSSVFIVLLLFENNNLFGINLFSQPNTVDLSLEQKWNHTANLSFFYNVNFYNLAFNPFKHLHSDSLIGILLLDSLGDYFGFYWQHNEVGNFFYRDVVRFTENFLIQNYLSEYISIIFTLAFYAVCFYYLSKKIDEKYYLLLPLAGLSILILNSLGIPVKNFDPTTGDLFKTHYYSFLFIFTFVYVLILLQDNKKFYKLIILFLIPLFLLVIGFPKENNSETSYEREQLFGLTKTCEILVFTSDCVSFEDKLCKRYLYEFKLKNVDVTKKEELSEPYVLDLILNNEKLIARSVSECYDSLEKGFEYEFKKIGNYSIVKNQKFNYFLFFCFLLSLYLQRRLKI